MEIIEHGSTYKEKICKKCGCKYHYTSNDIKTNVHSEDYYKYVECPECGGIFKLDYFDY